MTDLTCIKLPNGKLVAARIIGGAVVAFNEKARRRVNAPRHDQRNYTGAAPMSKSLPSIETLRQILRYESDTGRLFWKERPARMFKDSRTHKSWNTRCAGKEAGNLRPDGYLRLCINRRPIYNHRAAYAIFHGEWPEKHIDHWNGVLTDNRPSNLRDADHCKNARNAKMNKNNTSGHNGVSWFARDGKWQVAISFGGKRVYLGAYEKIEDAVAARLKADREHGYTKRHGT